MSTPDLRIAQAVVVADVVIEPDRAGIFRKNVWKIRWCEDQVIRPVVRVTGIVVAGCRG